MSIPESKRSPVREVKFAVEADAAVVAGYASVFGPPADAYNDVIERGAYLKTLADLQASGQSLPMLWSHQQEQPIGSWQELREDAHGLAVRGKINPGVERGREAIALLKGRDLSGLSIGYTVPRGGAVAGADGVSHLKAINLLEISLVAIPAAPRARATLKDFSDLAGFAGYLRDGGLSRRDAELIARKAWPALAESDSTFDEQQLERLAKRIDAATLRLKG